MFNIYSPSSASSEARDLQRVKKRGSVILMQEPEHNQEAEKENARILARQIRAPFQEPKPKAINLDIFKLPRPKN